jgi:hypothetical protein
MKLRLKSAHYFPDDKYLYGDKEREGEGTLVGDGTPYPVVAFSKAKPGEMCPTLEMEPLDDEAREALEEEHERLAATQASMLPLEQLARTIGQVQNMDMYEQQYVPGQGNVKRGK